MKLRPSSISAFCLQIIIQVFVQDIGNVHMSRSVSDNQRKLRIFDGCLRSYAASPEYRNLAFTDFNAVAVVRLVDILDSNGLRIADLNRTAVYIRIAIRKSLLPSVRPPAS